MSLLAWLGRLFAAPAPVVSPTQPPPPPPVSVAAVGDPPKHDAFDIAMEFILRPDHDGQGFHITPGDSGGATAYGVIGKTLATYRRVPETAITHDDIRALTPATVRPIYRRLFWDALRCGDMPPPLGVMVFDFACGNPTAAAVRLQRLLGVADDGAIGPITLAALQRQWQAKGAGLLDQYHAQRLGFYRLLSSYPKFGRGWENRANRCLTLVKGMGA